MLLIVNLFSVVTKYTVDLVARHHDVCPQSFILGGDSLEEQSLMILNYRTSSSKHQLKKMYMKI